MPKIMGFLLKKIVCATVSNVDVINTLRIKNLYVDCFIFDFFRQDTNKRINVKIKLRTAIAIIIGNSYGSPLSGSLLVIIFNNISGIT